MSLLVTCSIVHCRFYGSYEPNLAASLFDEDGLNDLKTLDDEGVNVPDGVDDNLESNEVCSFASVLLISN